MRPDSAKQCPISGSLPAATADQRVIQGGVVESRFGGGAAAVLTGTSSSLLERIHDPDVELVIWERALPSAVGCWLERLPAQQLPNGRLLVTDGQMSPAVTELLDDASMPGGDMRDAFLKDVLELTRLFMRTMATDSVDIRLEAISHDACWKFHRDHVAARMLTTYRGPGTEWVHPGDSDDALSDEKSYQGRIERFPDCAVGLFKGNRAGYGDGIVHRSPPIAETGSLRLLLGLNLPSAVSPIQWRRG